MNEQNLLKSNWKVKPLFSLFFSIIILLIGIFRPVHNFDEIPYSYLANNNSCESELYKTHLQALRRDSQVVNKQHISILSKQDLSFRKRFLEDSNYFCSIVPMYSSKSLYIVLLRTINEFTSNTLYSLRIVSALSASILFYIFSTIIFNFTPTKNLYYYLISIIFIGHSSIYLSRYSTPDAFATLMTALGVYFLSRSLSEKTNNKSTMQNIDFRWYFGLAFSLLAIYARNNLIICFIGLGFILKLLYRKSMKLESYLPIILVLYCLKGIIFKDILTNAPDSYSLITVLMSAYGGLYGLSGPIELNVYNLTFTDLIVNFNQYYPNLFLVAKISIQSFFPASAAIATSLLPFAPLITKTSSDQISKKFNFSSYYFQIDKAIVKVILLLILTFLFQALVFPKYNLRLVLPYTSLVISCLIYESSRITNSRFVLK